MKISDRIKKIRTFRKISQKELGVLLGFPTSSAQVRLAQYENDNIIPKEELAINLARVLNCNPANFMPNYSLSHIESIMLDLFWLEERLENTMQIFQLENHTNEDDSRKVRGSYNTSELATAYPPVAITIKNDLIDNYMREWAYRFKELSDGTITKEEYFEWKINFPKSCDDGGRFEPSYKWRKNSDTTK